MIKHKRPLGDQRTLVRQMISLIRLLDYLQSEGIAHRDIKPGNILIFPNKTHDQYFWKLADFGLALNIRENTKKDCFVGSL
jgi:serine/threonine protein kinase